MSSTVPSEKPSQRLSVNLYLTLTDPPPQLPTPPSSHLNVSSPANSMSPVMPPNYEGDSAKIVSSAGSNTIHILGDSVSPPYHHVHTCKSSSPIPVHTKTQVPLDTNHTSPNTGGKGVFTQQVCCEFFVVSEAICPVVTQQVSGGFF